MAEAKEHTHVVEIPADQEHQKLLSCAASNIAEAIEDHPLTEISESPGHLLLLKLWQREENLFAGRMARKESRLDSIRSELFQLCSFFFVFHGFFLTLLFTSWVAAQGQEREHHSACGKWWVPSMVSLCTSLVFVVLAQVKVQRYWKVWGQLQRERGDCRAVSRCITELRMKGASFDLSKGPSQNGGGGKRMKSSSVEIKWKPLTWCWRNSLTVCLVCFTGLAFPASKLVLCGL